MEAPDLRLAPGLTARACRMEDAAAVLATVHAMELEFNGERFADLEDILTEWSTPGHDFGRTIAVFDADVMVAEAEVWGRHVEVAVHPEHRDRGIGTALLAWSEEVARRAGIDDLNQVTSDRDLRAAALLERHGYTPRAEVWVLRIALTEAVRSPVLPDGYAFGTFVPGRDERALYEVVEGAFQDIPDRDARTYGEWAPQVVDRSDFDPGLVSVVAHEDVLVGAAIGFEFGGEAWVDRLGVSRDHRRLGIGRALLEESFRIFRERGHAGAALTTNSDTGALGLYQRAGMRIERSFTRRGRSLPPPGEAAGVARAGDHG